MADTTNSFAKYSNYVTNFADAPVERPDIDQVLKDARTLTAGDQELLQLVDLWDQAVGQRRLALAADRNREKFQELVRNELVNGGTGSDVMAAGVSRRRANFAYYLAINRIEPRVNGYAAERLHDFAELYAETYTLWCVAPDFLSKHWETLFKFFTEGNLRSGALECAAPDSGSAFAYCRVATGRDECDQVDGYHVFGQIDMPEAREAFGADPPRTTGVR